MFRYLDEQAFRFNNRKGTDAMRFALALKGIIGKRITYYTALTGSELPQTCWKKASRKSAVVDVRADDPEHAMEQFTDGLRRVLSAPKPMRLRPRRNHRKRSKAG